jgi:hypothetical protein
MERRALQHRFFIGALALWTLALPARAHDAPRMFGVLEDGEHGVFLTNRGLIFAEPSTGRFRLLCNEAIGYTTTEEPNAATLPDGSLLIATSGGLLRTDDEGCTFEGVEPFALTNAPALARDPEDASRLYLATYDAASGGIYVSTDGSASFTRTHQAPETQFIEELLVARSEPSVVYASGFDFSLSGPEREHFVLRSTDSGASFERIAVALAEHEADLTLLAVAPSDPDVLLARALDNGAQTRIDRLLVSRDGGRSWHAALEVHQLFAAGFTARAIWVTGIDGLYRSEDNVEVFEPVEGATTMAGVAELHGKSLVGGRFAPGRNGIASMHPGSATLAPWFEFNEVTEPVACELGTETAVTCEPLWRDWQNEILLGLGNDAGTAPLADAGSEPVVDAGNTAMDADTAPASNGKSSDGCCVAVHGLAKKANTHAAWATWVLAMLAYAVRRRRS